ncbi:MAG TPA: phosphoglycerate mutase family protein, partial [Bacillota bacterium]|nr:phosphoglycerate mutase family protein [Bacillota bacterium]
MNTICLMRHGETDANKKFIVQGRMDNPLNDYGRFQAKRTGEYLVRNHEEFDLVVSSPLKRAYET